MDDAPIALAGGLMLRRWRPEQAPALSRAVEESLDHLRPWMPWAASEPLAPAERVALLEQWDAEWERGDGYAFGLWLDGAVVGSCGLHRRIGPGGLEIGYWVHPGHLRHGHATAAAAGLTTRGLACDGIDHVEICNDRANTTSARIPRRLGFQLVGTRRHEAVAPSETGVRQVWRMDAVRWAPAAAARR